MEKLRKSIIILYILMLMTLTSTIAIANNYYDSNPWNDGGAEAVFLGLSGLCCFLVILPFIIGLLIGIWVYKDAEKRGKSGVLWLLVVWLVPFPIGLIIWLIVRPPIPAPQTTINQTIQTGTQQSSERRCPGCGRVIPNDAQVCPYCGKKFGE